MSFIHDESIVLPKMKQRNLDSGRVYLVEGGPDEGMVFPSITRMLKHAPKPQLEAWRRRVGAIQAARVSARATVQGTNIHTAAQRFLENQDLPNMSPNVIELWRHLRPWLILNITRVFRQECAVYSLKLLLAGSFDLLADVNEELSVVDFKTSTREKKKEWIEDYFVQGCFYALAVYELTGQKVKRVIIPVMHPDGLQIFECKPLEYLPILLKRNRDFYADFVLTEQEKEGSQVSA